MRLTAILKAMCLALLPALVAVGCGGDSQTTTSPTEQQVSETLTIDVYATPLDPGGSSRFLATLETDSTLQVMLAGEQLSDPIRTVSVPLKLDISTWDGSDCVALQESVTAPRLTAALHLYLKTGTYCVRVTDPGTLAESVGVVLRVSHPAPTRLQGTASPATLSSVITPGGIVTKSFTTSSAGTITVQLSSLSANVTAKLGIGVVSSSNSACTLTKIVEVRPGTTPQISESADAGIYCAAVLDAGNFTGVTNFTMDIRHP